MNEHTESASGSSDDLRALAIDFGIAAPKLDIIERLVRGPATIAELALACGFTRNGVEPHLAVLEALDLVAAEVVRMDGVFRPTRRYTIDPGRLEEVRWTLYDVLDFAQQPSERQTG